MAGTVGNRLRLGVIGLGRGWESHQKPALLRLRDRVEVTALFDQVARRAELEADQMRCRPVSGLKALVDSPDVDAVAWLAPQWFGTQPLVLAHQVGKPIYCGVSLPDDPAELGFLTQLLALDSQPIRWFWPAAVADEPAIAEHFRQFDQYVRGLNPAASWAAAAASIRALVAERSGSPS